MLDLKPSDLDWKRITACQGDAAKGIYAVALAGFVQWLAGRYDAVREAIPAKIGELRERLSDKTTHLRTSTIIANLFLGLDYFLQYACDVGAVSRAEARFHRDRAWAALGDAAAVQVHHQEDADPTRRFFEFLAAAIASGHAHIASDKGRVPDEPPAWGWRQLAETSDWLPQGDRVGWLQGDELYLEPEASFAVAQRFARDAGESIPIGAKTFHKRLNEQRLLLSTDQARNKLTVRRVLERQRRNVLHLKSTALTRSE